MKLFFNYFPEDDVDATQHHSNSKADSLETDTMRRKLIPAAVKYPTGNERINGNALCRDNGTGRQYEGLSESQIIDAKYLPLTPEQRLSMVGALVEPNNQQYTQSMFDSGIGLYAYPASEEDTKKIDVYIGCPSSIDRNAVPMNVSTGLFERGVLSKETFDNEYFIR